MGNARGRLGIWTTFSNDADDFHDLLGVLLR